MQPTDGPKLQVLLRRSMIIATAVAMQIACGGKIAPDDGGLGSDRVIVSAVDETENIASTDDNGGLGDDRKDVDGVETSRPDNPVGEASADPCAILTNGALATTCFGTCVDLATSKDHCGACGAPCLGEECRKGICL